MLVCECNDPLFFFGFFNIFIACVAHPTVGDYKLVVGSN